MSHPLLSSLLFLLLPLATSASPRPFHVPTDTPLFIGNTGRWSTLTLRVGTPPQPIFVHPHLSTSLTTVPFLPWCSNLTLSGYSCESRGRGFSPSSSTSWKQIGQYKLDIRPELESDRTVYGVTDLGYGEFGGETVAMQRGGEEGEVGRGVMVEEVALGAVNDSTRLEGGLGLGVEVRSFDAQRGYGGVLEGLWKKEEIPGRSFGYTAGNYQRTQKTPLDLVLGGHNTGRYVPNNQTFPLSAGDFPLATLKTLRVSATGSPPWGPGPQDLLLTPVSVQLDSATPFLWLPTEICRRFEQSLNLTWNESTNLYLLPDTVSTNLIALNLSFNFTLTSTKAGSSSSGVEISVPYASFDLRLKWPFTNDTRNPEGVRYFPLKRATRDEQYTLGRTFMQDAYIIVDYDRGNFSVHQALETPGEDEIVAILHPDDAPTPAGHKPSGLGKGVIIGIAVVGVVVGISAILGLMWALKRRKRMIEREKDEKRRMREREQGEYFVPPQPGVAEALGDVVYSPWMKRPISEMGGSMTMLRSEGTVGRVEIGGGERHELTAVGMEAAELGTGTWRGGDTLVRSEIGDIEGAMTAGTGTGELSVFLRELQSQQGEAYPPTEPGSDSMTVYSQGEGGSRQSQLVTPTSTALGSVSRWSPMSPMTPPANLREDNEERRWYAGLYH